MNPSEEKAKPPEKQKALCVATRCATVEQFVATFHRFCDDSSFFVATLATRPVGLETAFSIQLEDKTPVLRGLCVVVEAWSTPANRFGRPGVRLNVRRLTNESLPVFKQLQAARIAAEEAAKQAEETKPEPEVTFDSKTADMKLIDATSADKAGVAKPVPLETKPADTKPIAVTLASKVAGPEPSLAEKLAAVKSGKGLPRKPEGIPPIPKISPTAFASPPPIPGPAKPAPIAAGTLPPPEPVATPVVVAPPPPEPVATPVVAPPVVAPPEPEPVGNGTANGAHAAPSIVVEIAGQPTKIEPAKVRAEGTAPMTRTTPPAGVPRNATAIGISTSTLSLSNAPHAEDTQVAAAPEPIAPSDDMTSPVASESRAPGSSFVLPANPLMNLSDQSLEGFVDCALYEETGNFAKAPGYEDSLVDIDDVAAPPPQLPPGLMPAPVIRHGNEHSTVSYIGPQPMSPYAYGPPPQQQMFAPEATPLPMMQYPAGQPYPAGQMPYPAPMPYPRQSGTTNPPYAMPHAQPPVDSTAALLALSAPSRKRWMIIGGSAVIASLLLLVIVIATRGDDKTATAATTKEKPAVEPTQQAVVTPPPVQAVKEPVAPAQPAIDPDAAAEAASDTGAPPSVGAGPCKMTVTTTPAGSIVRVDDQVIGPSPVTINGPCKRTKVDAKHPRYAPAMKWVVLGEDKPASVDLPMTRPTHAITIVTQPAGATISISGKRAGTSPTQVKLMGFTTVALTIEKKGYKTVTEKVYSKIDGERRTVTLTRGK